MDQLGDAGLTPGQRIGQVETAVVGLNNRVTAMERRQDRYDGRLDIVIFLAKWLLGTSAVGLVVTFVTLYLLLSGGSAK